MNYDIDQKIKEEKTYIEFMKDVLRDRNKDVAFMKVAILLLSIFVIIMIVGIVFVNIYNQNLIKEQAENSEKRMYEFLSEYDFEGDLDLESSFNDNNSGNINVTR